MDDLVTEGMRGTLAGFYCSTDSNSSIVNIASQLGIVARPTARMYTQANIFRVQLTVPKLRIALQKQQSLT